MKYLFTIIVITFLYSCSKETFSSTDIPCDLKIEVISEKTFSNNHFQIAKPKGLIQTILFNGKFVRFFNIEDSIGNVIHQQFSIETNTDSNSIDKIFKTKIKNFSSTDFLKILDKGNLVNNGLEYKWLLVASTEKFAWEARKSIWFYTKKNDQLITFSIQGLNKGDFICKYLPYFYSLSIK